MFFQRLSLVRSLKTLRLRILLGTLFGIALTVAGAGFALNSLFRQHIEAQYYGMLQMHIDQLAAHLSINRSGEPYLSVPQSDPRFTRPYSGLYWQIDELSDGQPPAAVLRSRSLWDDVLRLPLAIPANGPARPAQSTQSAQSVLLAGPNDATLGALEQTLSIDDADPGSRRFRLIVAGDERQIVEPIDRFNGIVWFALALLGGGLGATAVAQVLITLLPLKRLQHALAAVRSGRTRQLEGLFPGEVQPLVEEFNSALAQNAGIVDRARMEAGYLAHALKTPLSIISNATERQDNDTARMIFAQVGLARKRIDYHLTRARTAAALTTTGVSTPVRPTVDGLVRVMQRIYATKAIAFSVGGSNAALRFRGEEQDLQEVLGNLLDNACKWTRTRVDITLDAADDVLAIRVEDDGCGIDDSALEAVLQRGRRLSEQEPGHGLGLSIVDELVSLYGGCLLLSRAEAGGLCVDLRLPRVPD